MPRRLAVSVGFGGNAEQNKQVIERIKVAEEVGVEAVFTAETWGRDQFSLLTQIALQTSKIKLGTGIAPVFGRSPAVLAMTAATLDELSGGRVVLGLALPATVSSSTGTAKNSPSPSSGRRNTSRSSTRS
jgi:alkanesulfonate monooxygenase SsuD/methylene tetrahydromethanopterin reductase-like flavin-dependent oxidoreductase (luciferase family)